jgi:hypothetical protein
MEAVEFGTSAESFTGSSTTPKQQAPDIQERLAAAKRLVDIASKVPLSLEEIRNERLARL